MKNNINPWRTPVFYIIWREYVKGVTVTYMLSVCDIPIGSANVCWPWLTSFWRKGFQTALLYYGDLSLQNDVQCHNLFLKGAKFTILHTSFYFLHNLIKSKKFLSPFLHQLNILNVTTGGEANESSWKAVFWIAVVYRPWKFKINYYFINHISLQLQRMHLKV